MQHHGQAPESIAREIHTAYRYACHRQLPEQDRPDGLPPSDTKPIVLGRQQGRHSSYGKQHH